MTQSLTAAHAADWARVAREVIARPYPYAAGHVAWDAEDTDLTPQRLHPAFWGSLDWHSCVHMTWSLLTLLEQYADPLAEAGEVEPVRSLLNARLTPEHLAVETAYVRSRPGFERPYGWAWAAMLGARLARSDLEGADRWWAAVGPMVDVVAEHLLAWLPRQAYPVRHGTHGNSAFALSLAHTAYLQLGRTDVVQTIERRALDWFGGDTAYPTRFEPSGTDFLSPALCEAELMQHVLPQQEYVEWLGGFLPGLGEQEHALLLHPPQVRDRTDGQLVHLHGLALSRAWALREIADAVPGGHGAVLRDAAQMLVEGVLPEITDGDFMATHWLVSFALLAQDGVA